MESKEKSANTQPQPIETPTPVGTPPVAPIIPQQPGAPLVPPVLGTAQQPIYIVQEQSLNGIGGWLTFWIIIFALAGLTYISTFINGLSGVNSNPVPVVFSPFLAIGYIGSVVLISMRRRLAITVSLITIGLATLEWIVNSIVSANGVSPAVSITSGVMTNLVFGGLVSLYFFNSKRVKQTLIK